MANTVIYTFSGTGNSLYAARKLASILDAEVKYIVSAVERKEFSVEAEKVVFVFPVYNWGPPLIVETFLKNAEFKNTKHISAVYTYASSAGSTAGIVSNLIKERGAHLNYVKPVKMPSNYIPFLSVKAPAKVGYRLSAANITLEKTAENIKNNKENGPFRTKKLSKKVFDMTHAKMGKMDKKFYLTEGCIKCGTCVKVCPASDITLEENGPVWHNKCMQCMACINYCPVKVIQIKRAFSTLQPRYHHPDIPASDIEAQKI
ncbi:4Fe-4S dicluster domain-containing protein [Parelusimicrobium proximum]|uniref:EFR1 family ferrodoxin n=1 Tax=Parelusimicrobium proximum TaxID=3228953 RepID=UPI003D168F6B